MTVTIESMPIQIDQLQLAWDLVDRARAEGVELVGASSSSASLNSRLGAGVAPQRRGAVSTQRSSAPVGEYETPTGGTWRVAGVADYW